MHGPTWSITTRRPIAGSSASHPTRCWPAWWRSSSNAKGHRHLLAALDEVLPVQPGLQVLIFGRGPLEAEIGQAIVDRGLSGRVRLMGFGQSPGRAGLPRPAGAPCRHGRPRRLAAAGLGGAVPIIASRAGGMPEAVRDGENGLLIAPGDVAALAAAMQRLLGDAALRARMGEAGRALVLKGILDRGDVRGQPRDLPQGARPMKSLHLIGSKNMGGAERWFTRFMHAMVRHGEPVEAVVRRGSRAGGAPPRRPAASRAAVSHRLGSAHPLRGGAPPQGQRRADRADLHGPRHPPHPSRTGPRQGPCVAPRRVLQARPLPPCACLDRQHQGAVRLDDQGRPAGSAGFPHHQLRRPRQSGARGRARRAARAHRARPRRLADRYCRTAHRRQGGTASWSRRWAACRPRSMAGGCALVVLGDGNLRSSLEEQARQLGAAERILWPAGSTIRRRGSALPTWWCSPHGTKRRSAM